MIPRSVLVLLVAVLAVLTVVAGIGAPGAGAAPMVGGQQTLSDPLRGLPSGAPSATYDTTLDRSLVVWASDADDSSTSVVWGRFATTDSGASGPPFRVSAVGTGVEGRDAAEPRVIYLPTMRQYFVTFLGPRNPSVPGGLEVYGQWLDDQGGRVGPTMPISRGSTGTVGRARTAAAAGGTSVVVAYDAVRVSRPDSVVLVQRVAPGDVGPAMEPIPASLGASDAPTLLEAPGGPALIARIHAPDGATTLVAGRLGSDLGLTTQPRLLAAVGAGPSDGLTAGSWNAPTGEFGLIWKDGATTVLTRADPTLAPVTVRGVDWTGATAEQLSITASATDGTSLVAWRAAPDGPVVVREVDGALEPTSDAVVFPGVAPTEPSRLARSAPELSIAQDTTRGWWLVPYVVDLPQPVGAARHVVGRLIAPTVRPAPAPVVAAPTQPPVAQSRCLPPTQLFDTEAGPSCGPRPVGAFGVGTVTTRKQRRLLGLAVSPSAPGLRIRVECVVRCAGATRVLKRAGRRRTTTILFDRWKLRPRALIEVRVERPGSTSRFRRLRVLEKFPFLQVKRDGCRLATGVEAPC